MTDPDTTSPVSRRRAARRIGVEQSASYDERREIILREAAIAFVAEGVANTSIDDLAVRLGVTKPAIYHYFGSKDELLTSCFDVAIAEYQALLDDAVGYRGRGIDRIRHLFAQWTRVSMSDFGRTLVMIDVTYLNPASRKRYVAAQRDIEKSIETMIRNGIADRSIRDCNPVFVARALISVFNAPASWFRDGLEPDIEDVTSELLALTVGVT